MFAVDSVVRRHHGYKRYGLATYVGEKLSSPVESSNIHYMYAVAVKWDGAIVGHMPNGFDYLIWPLPLCKQLDG